MPAELLDGKALADRIRDEIAAEVAALRAGSGKSPGLTVVLAGNNPASETYVRNKGRAAEVAGIRSETIRLPASVSKDELLSLIDTLNRRDDVDGILVQLPLPDSIDKDRVLLAVAPEKDVDGFHPINVGNLVANREGFVACTPAGVMELLHRSGVELCGREAVVLGRSDIVGKPMALLLLHANATVTVCHSRTRDLPEVTRRAEVLIAAIGKAGFVTGEHVRPGATVIDVGINRIDDRAHAARLFAADPARLAEFDRKGSALVGDCNPAEVGAVAGRLTPVPGGVGPLTIAMLLKNTVRGFRRFRLGQR
jgi:methylenetetrahydrofolate dehydrogenase (NADP+)/methenyltetrahydrofolate cyclohydrolase